MRMEVALSGTVEGWVLGVLSTVVVFDVFKTLSEIFMVVRLAPVCLVNDVSEKGSKLALANFSLSQAKSGVTLTAELGEKTSSNDESLIRVKLVVEGEQMLIVLLAKDLHDHSDVLFVVVLRSRTAVQSS